MEEKINYNRYDGIQALRFIAVLMVVITHSFLYASERLKSEEVFFWNVGAQGVDIFFVISGFVMIISSEKLMFAQDGWKQFLFHRILRIVPPYWAATSFKLIVLIIFSGLVLHATLDWSAIFKSYFFIPSRNIDGEIKPFLGVGWTLVFEMFFYSLFTLALLFRINVYVFVGSILSIFSLLYFVRPPNYSSCWYLMNPIILEFLMGMVIGYFTLKKQFIPRVPAILACVISVIYILFFSSSFNVHRVIVSGLPCMLLVWSIISLEVYFQNRINSIVLLLGASSYVLYLFHPLTAPLIPVILNKVGFPNFSISVLLSVTFAVFTTTIIHIWFERPLTSFLKSKLKPKFLG